ncbi:MAG: class I SAM-dependent methyltransferase, partial [Gemmatimonadales bacterium]|nr:class I SAM-dependent methyltransferase [Gemmatimonadales bacterium]
EWFEEWFGEEYLALYPHRDEDDAVALVTLLHGLLGWGPGWRVLDICCGPGRHAQALDAAGLAVVGLDLSSALLRRAREVTSAPLVRADIRALPVRGGSMDAGLNLFTSFGYFDSDDEHVAALTGMVATVRRGGWFVLDFLNAALVRARIPEGADAVEHGADGSRVRRYVTPGGSHVVKEIRLRDGRRFQERVRLFSAHELEVMLAGAGARVRHRFGDYEGGAPHAGAPRTLLLAEVS